MENEEKTLINDSEGIETFVDDRTEKKKVSKKTLCVLGAIITVVICVALMIAVIIPSIKMSQFKSAIEKKDYAVAKEIYSKQKQKGNDISKYDEYIEKQLTAQYDAYNNGELAFEEATKNTKGIYEISKSSNTNGYNTLVKNLTQLKDSKFDYEQGSSYFKKKNYVKAFNCFSTVIKEDKNYDVVKSTFAENEEAFIDAITKKAKSLTKKNQYDDALLIVNRGINWFSSSQALKDSRTDITKKKEEYEKQNRIKLLKNTIVATAWTDTPNYAGGVDLYIKFENLSDKVIKYADFKCEAYNDVGDTVECEIWDRSVVGCRYTGPAHKGEGLSGSQYEGYWRAAWHNSSISHTKIVGIEIEYIDGSTIIIGRDEIKYIEY